MFNDRKESGILCSGIITICIGKLFYLHLKANRPRDRQKEEGQIVDRLTRGKAEQTSEIFKCLSLNDALRPLDEEKST